VNDLKYMRLALAEAKRAGSDVPVGSLLVAPDGRLLAKAHNVRERDSDPAGHAELVVLREVARESGTWRLDGCTLYVTLEPCAMCATAIVDAGLERVVFGAWDKRLGAAGSKYDILRDKAHGSGIQVVSGIMEKECSELLSRFFKSQRL
jgi:tRNA(adenine34) deaminase